MECRLSESKKFNIEIHSGLDERVKFTSQSIKNLNSTGRGRPWAKEKEREPCWGENMIDIKKGGEPSCGTTKPEQSGSCETIWESEAVNYKVFTREEQKVEVVGRWCNSRRSASPRALVKVQPMDLLLLILCQDTLLRCSIRVPFNSTIINKNLAYSP